MSTSKLWLPEVYVDPLGDMMLDFLIERDKEEPFIDFKETLSIAKESAFAKTAKHIFAFSNYGGGFLLIGFKKRPRGKKATEQTDEKRNFIPIGLPQSFFIDQADLQEKFNSFSNSPMQLDYHEFFRNIDGLTKKFAAIYVPPSTCVLKPVKKGVYVTLKGKVRTAFDVGDVLFRRGTQSIVASKGEITWIQRRAENESYRLSVLSGQPDEVQETIYSNMFEVVKLPNIVWTAFGKSKTGSEQGLSKSIYPKYVYVRWRKKMVTFCDISKPENPLQDMVDPKSIRLEELSAWLDDNEKKRVVIQLLNKEISFLAKRLGLRETSRKTKFMKRKWTKKFYFPCIGENRIETWRPRFRKKSTLTVAQRMWAQQLNRFIFWHIAVKARFTYVKQRLFLRLLPTVIITEDGRKSITGGTIVTRLIYNRYNSSYLNSLLFWISRFAEEKENIALANGRILVSSKPVQSKIDVGILFDRPTRELVQEVPQIELQEEE